MLRKTDPTGYQDHKIFATFGHLAVKVQNQLLVSQFIALTVGVRGLPKGASCRAGAHDDRGSAYGMHWGKVNLSSHMRPSQVKEARW